MLPMCACVYLLAENSVKFSKRIHITLKSVPVQVLPTGNYCVNNGYCCTPACVCTSEKLKFFYGDFVSQEKHGAHKEKCQFSSRVKLLVLDKVSRLCCVKGTCMFSSVKQTFHSNMSFIFHSARKKKKRRCIYG